MLIITFNQSRTASVEYGSLLVLCRKVEKISTLAEEYPKKNLGRKQFF